MTGYIDQQRRYKNQTSIPAGNYNETNHKIPPWWRDFIVETQLS